MYALYFDSAGTMARVPVPENTKITRSFYKENILTIYSALRYNKRTERCALSHLLYDNVPSRRSAVAIEYLEKHHVKTLPHPSYSPDLSPCDILIIPCTKETHAQFGSSIVVQWVVNFFQW